MSASPVSSICIVIMKLRRRSCRKLIRGALTPARHAPRGCYFGIGCRCQCNRRRPAMSEGLLERLAHGPVVCAEGYLFECERRGYVQAGAFVPEVVLEHPEVVAQLHRDFVHSGSDVVEALTYYAHREKLRVIGREADLVPINRRALQLAKDVAMESGALFAGDICNT